MTAGRKLSKADKKHVGASTLARPKNINRLQTAVRDVGFQTKLTIILKSGVYASFTKRTDKVLQNHLQR